MAWLLAAGKGTTAPPVVALAAEEDDDDSGRRAAELVVISSTTDHIRERAGLVVVGVQVLLLTLVPRSRIVCLSD
jgi:hypothetical protein